MGCVRGVDNSQRAHDSASAKPNSGATAAIPRSRSLQRSRGKFKPVRVARNSLRADNAVGESVGGMAFSGGTQRLIQGLFFFQRKEFIQAVDEDQTVLEFEYALHIRDVGQDVFRGNQV